MRRAILGIALCAAAWAQADSPIPSKNTRKQSVEAPLGNSKETVVTISDHGDPAGRLISVSRDVAEELGFARAGPAQVRIDVVKE